MKIVDLNTFRAMPKGTIFMKYEPCIFQALCVKGETWEHDFTYADITSEIDAKDSGEAGEKLYEAENNPSISVPIVFNFYGRDGCFEDKQLFAVYEQNDIRGLISVLLKSLRGVI